MHLTVVSACNLAYSSLKLSALQCWHLAISARSKTLYENLCTKIVQNSFNNSKITSNQLTINDVICDVVFVNNNAANSLLMNFDCPVDTSASTHSSCHGELAPNQLPRFHCQRPVASKITRVELLGLPCLGGNVGGLSQAPSETENDRRTEGSPAGDLGEHTSGTNRQSCQRVLKATEGLCCS